MIVLYLEHRAQQILTNIILEMFRIDGDVYIPLESIGLYVSGIYKEVNRSKHQDTQRRLYRWLAPSLEQMTRDGQERQSSTPTILSLPSLVISRTSRNLTHSLTHPPKLRYQPAPPVLILPTKHNPNEAQGKRQEQNNARHKEEKKKEQTFSQLASQKARGAFFSIGFHY